MIEFLTSPKTPDATTEQGAVGFRQRWNQHKAPTNWWVGPQHVLSVANSVLSAGRATFHPIALNAGTYDSLAVSAGVAQSGGTITFYLALYGEQSNGLADTAAGTLLSGTTTLTSATIRDTGTLTAAVLPAGNYWAMSLYVVTSAPTTAPQLLCINNNVQSLPWSTWSQANTSRGRQRATQTAPPTDSTTTANWGQIGTSDVPLICVRKSA